MEYSFIIRNNHTNKVIETGSFKVEKTINDNELLECIHKHTENKYIDIMKDLSISVSFTI